ncbi:MAG: hypothetical protein V7K55_12280 [Nostoc sp.]|uniref:hypothetical protein n=1 Tax=Nostoc sp. TaxID=1180 RepID=UPI002FFAC6ED
MIVVREPQTGQKLAVIFPYQLMIIPCLVRSVILLALEQGWQPTERRLKEFRIFDVDKQIIPSFEIIGKKIYATN